MGSALDNERFPWLSVREVEVAGIGLRALRLSFTGELGWELHVPMGDLPELFDAIAASGESHRLGFFGSHALNSMRMEVGYKVSADMTNEVTAFEAGLMRFVEIDKGAFVGRDALLSNMQSPRWKLVYLRVETGSVDADCLGGEGVFKGDERVGVVTTAGFGFTTGASLAWAYVDPEQSEPGNELIVLVLGATCRASVLGEPVWDPDSERPRS